MEIREREPQPVAYIRRTGRRDGLNEMIPGGLGAVAQALGRAGLTPDGPPYVRWWSFSDDEVEAEIGVPLSAPVEGLSPGSLPGGPAAFHLHEGHYDALSETYETLESWIEDQDLEPGSAPWEVYLTDPESTPDPAGWRTEVWWPLG